MTSRHRAGLPVQHSAGPRPISGDGAEPERPRKLAGARQPLERALKLVTSESLEKKLLRMDLLMNLNGSRDPSWYPCRHLTLPRSRSYKSEQRLSRFLRGPICSTCPWLYARRLGGPGRELARNLYSPSATRGTCSRSATTRSSPRPGPGPPMGRGGRTLSVDTEVASSISAWRSGGTAVRPRPASGQRREVR